MPLPLLRAGLLCLAQAVSLVGLGSSVASADITKPCRAPGTLVEATATTAITTVKYRRNGPRVGRWGCARGQKAIPVDSGFASAVGFDGKYAFVGIGGCPGTPFAQDILSWNLRTKKSVSVTSGPGGSGSIGFGYGRVPQVIEGTGTGTVFWIASAGATTGLDGFPAGQRTYELFRGDRHRVVRLVDSGPGIDPRSLAVSANRAYWVNGTEIRSTT